jgi:hypothetical protein
MQILESPHMKMFYRKLPKTASLTFTCHPLRTLLDFFVSSSFLRKRDSLISRLSSDVIEKNNRFLTAGLLVEELLQFHGQCHAMR